jgi:predicted nucleic acid-binding Zn ribbon protein
MPNYCYQCACGHKLDQTLPVSQCQRLPKCPECAQQMERDYIQEQGHTQHHAGNWPMKSLAAGVHPSQVNEAVAQSRTLGVPTEFTSGGDAIFTSARHRKRYCEAVGLHANDAGYGDPVPKNR